LGPGGADGIRGGSGFLLNRALAAWAGNRA
jgi:hypothetical protein